MGGLITYTHGRITFTVVSNVWLKKACSECREDIHCVLVLQDCASTTCLTWKRISVNGVKYCGRVTQYVFKYSLLHTDFCCVMQTCSVLMSHSTLPYRNVWW